MGMVLALGSLSEATIRRVLEDPPLIWQVIAPDDPEAYERARREEAEQRRPGFLARLFGARPDGEPRPATPPAPLTLGDGEGDAGDIDKAWHGIHFLLTGSAEEGGLPLGFLVGGGTFVGHEEVGYGPARVFTPPETREIAAALGAVSDDELRRRFDPAAMMAAQIYPEIWDRDPQDDDTLGYLMEHVASLRGVLAAITARGHGLLVYLC